ncbi:MAG: glycosyltransferase family 4 protein, partial [Bacteroidales bacterium]|nr:glycosyltransferase family 4 protein [Bacteroidales bacterium]
MNKKKRVCLFYLDYSTFVREDDKILSSKFELTKYRFINTKVLHLFVLQFIKQFLFLLLNIRKFDVYYCWFSDYHSFLPMLFGKIFHKKNIIIVGGYDAVAVPQINFGVFLKKNLRNYCASKSYKFADIIVPVDKSLVEGINYYADPTGKGLLTGVKNFVKRIKGDFVVVPTGYNERKWRNFVGKKKEKSVVTIAGAPNIQTFRRKGLDFLIEIAKIMPDIEFTIIGLKGEMLEYAKTQASKNVNLIGFVPYDELPEYISKYKVFAQFSLSEGLPNTLCEAMLCECIPVGSSANGIPYGIGDCGFVLKEKNVEKGAELIRKALESDYKLGVKARQRIINNFLIEKRKQKIID